MFRRAEKSNFGAAVGALCVMGMFGGNVLADAPKEGVSRLFPQFNTRLSERAAAAKAGATKPPVPPLPAGERKVAASQKPLPGGASDAAAAKANPTPPQPPASHVVKPTYKIESGDTFSSIALRLYDDESKWVSIAQANPLIDPMRLKVGQMIRLPLGDTTGRQRDDRARELRRQLAQPGAAPRIIIVESGDTLSDIARRAYGQANDWPLIYRSNRNRLAHPDRIRPGMHLTIPPRSAARSQRRRP